MIANTIMIIITIMTILIYNIMIMITIIMIMKFIAYRARYLFMLAGGPSTTSVIHYTILYYAIL